MLIAFVLTMPNNNSWNGKWSGAGRCYAVVKSVSDAKKNAAKYRAILDKRHFSYNFGDGWRASVEVFQSMPSEARRLRKHSEGFCGYDWMIDTILEHGEIRCEVRDDKWRRGYQTSGNSEVHWEIPPVDDGPHEPQFASGTPRDDSIKDDPFHPLQRMVNAECL